uniref:Phosphodiester glycosidase family protein n=1 Tax=Desulfobacca acetoxidans TaxID=60893 RepID=A0A7C3ZCD3_9BACT
MFLRILGAVLLWVLCLSMPWRVEAQQWSHTPPQWRVLSHGLAFTEVQVFYGSNQVDTLAIVKIDPAFNDFRVFHHAPQSLAAWQEEIKAPVVFNASYYNPDSQPVGLVIIDGKPLGPLYNSKMQGMFVAEPLGMSPDLPRATILDLKNTKIDLKKFPWKQGVQSFPLLLDYKGQIRVKESGRKSYRTVITADRNGNILVFNTADNNFTLYKLAQFLKASSFNIDSALNLDGGAEAQLYIKTKDFEFYSPPSWQSRLGNIMDQPKFWLPTVIGVFPRPQ